MSVYYPLIQTILELSLPDLKELCDAIATREDVVSVEIKTAADLIKMAEEDEENEDSKNTERH